MKTYQLFILLIISVSCATIKPNQKINPKRNLSLITNDKLPHRVLPVITGERYSIVVFCVIPNKDKKTML